MTSGLSGREPVVGELPVGPPYREMTPWGKCGHGSKTNKQKARSVLTKKKLKRTLELSTTFKTRFRRILFIVHQIYFLK